MKGCIFSVLCYYWLNKISGRKNGQNTGQVTKNIKPDLETVCCYHFDTALTKQY